MIKLVKTELIENYRLNKKLTIIDFCNLCNISERDYKKLLAHNYNFNAVVLFKIAKFLNLQILDILEK